MLPSLYALPFYDFYLLASHAHTLLPAALASVPFGFVLVRVRVRVLCTGMLLQMLKTIGGSAQGDDYGGDGNPNHQCTQRPMRRGGCSRQGASGRVKVLDE